MTNYIIVNGELYHYGVKGMHWGVRKAYNRWRVRRNKKKQDKWNERAENTKFKSYFNPAYVIRKGIADGHAHRAEKHAETLEVLEWITKYDRAISAISDDIVKLGRNFIRM